ncbi:MAG: bis-aminopropyl spermidine synthase family protein, partial [Myxococcales bacterium]|nr:bis-aminopropyl spermidine synthase family protein [Myxococcales bacterium]
MNEGVYRVLRVLGDGRARERAELARESGEALSVLDDALRRHPSWFEERERALRASQDGFAALGRELLARAPRGLEEAPSPSALEAYRAQAVARAAPRRELDQVYATEASVFARAARLIEAGEVQRGIAFLGDDDLTSLAIHLLGVARQTTVIDVDPAVLERLAAAAEAGGWEHRGI